MESDEQKPKVTFINHCEKCGIGWVEGISFCVHCGYEPGNEPDHKPSPTEEQTAKEVLNELNG